MKMNAIGLITGLLFGLGLAISGMILPQKVQNFLDVTGNWDPSLILVMGGALLVFMPGYFLLVKPRQRALNGEVFHLPSKRQIDRRLLVGSALFGIGWGLGGVCPGPALANLAGISLPLLAFMVAMLLGIWLVCRWDARQQ